MLPDRINVNLVDLDDSNFKSCFARSMALNSSQRKYSKASLSKQKQTATVQSENSFNSHKINDQTVPLTTPSQPNANILRKEYPLIEDTRRCLPGSNVSSRRGSLCSSSRISEAPMENILYQSQIDSLQWHLKQIKASRDMYKAVMKQMITYLEKTHKSLDTLSTRLNNQTRTSSQPARSRSEHHVSSISSTSTQLDTLDERAANSTLDYSTFKDFTWRRHKKPDYSNDEIPPAKLSQEAFRLLRTAQSLLNTEEPDLLGNDGNDQTANDLQSHYDKNDEDDAEFLAQLAKEFPRVNDNSNRTSYYSMCPKLIKQPEECKISMAIKRNIPLQNNVNDDSDDIISLDNSMPIMSSTMNEKIIAEGALKEKKLKCSPPSSNAGSTEDESGFSSMNSYQEIGIPLRCEDVKHRKPNKRVDKDEDVQSIDEIKLWQKPDYPFHRRWSSTPVDVPTDQPIKVLWV